MFQFPDLPRPILCIQIGVTRHNSGGVAPFGDPRILVCNDFPWHFAVYCVLHRLLTPRYPPCALCSLTKVWIFSRTAGHCRVFQTTLMVEILENVFLEYGPQYAVFRVQSRFCLMAFSGWPSRRFFETCANHQYYQMNQRSYKCFSELFFRVSCSLVRVDFIRMSIRLDFWRLAESNR